MSPLPGGGWVDFFSSTFGGYVLLLEAVKAKGRIYTRPLASWGRNRFSASSQIFSNCLAHLYVVFVSLFKCSPLVSIWIFIYVVLNCL
jgi:hypothetical protein